MKTILLIGLLSMSLRLDAQPFNSVSHMPELKTVLIRNSIAERSITSVTLMEKSLADTTDMIHTCETLPGIEMFLPLDSLQISSPYGVRIHPVEGQKHFHHGVDLRAGADTVKAILKGEVIRCGYDQHLGYFIRIWHGPIESLYGHLSMYFVQSGDRVNAGQPIGVSGNTGSSTGEHLHFSILRNGKPVNPLGFLATVLQFNNHHKQIKSIYGNTNVKTAMH
ncbi:MAG: M23 family metallopeptidase [Mangrovibacterium sp.]